MTVDRRSHARRSRRIGSSRRRVRRRRTRRRAARGAAISSRRSSCARPPNRSSRPPRSRPASRERFGLEPREIAVMAASHSGEPFHVEAVRSILRKIGMDESALQCGAHVPYDEAAAARELACRAASRRRCTTTAPASTPGFSRSASRSAPIPRRIWSSTILRSGTFWRSVRALLRRRSRRPGRSASTAAAFPSTRRACAEPRWRSRALATLDGVDERDAQALRIVRDAMVAHPEYVSGTGRIRYRC